MCTYLSFYLAIIHKRTWYIHKRNENSEINCKEWECCNSAKDIFKWCGGGENERMCAELGKYLFFVQTFFLHLSELLWIISSLHFLVLWVTSSPIFSRCAAIGNHVLLWLHVRLGQLLCVYDLLPCLRLTGAGGESAAFLLNLSTNVCIIHLDRPCFCSIVVTRESGGPPNLAPGPLFQSDGGGG